MRPRPKTAAKPAAAKTSAAVEAMKNLKLQQSPVALRNLRNKLGEARELELEIEERVEALAEVRAKLTKLRTLELPDIFQSLGIKDMTLEKDGNYPAYATKLKPWYSASIPKDPDAAERALRYVRDVLKCPDIIKTSYIVDFGKGEDKKARALEKVLKKSNLEYSAKTGVHSSTLTAEVRRRYEAGQTLSPKALEIIGAQVGKIVELKKVED